MKLIKMIKSGLVNQKRGGGFEQGYPSQKYPRGRDEFIRPYVDNSDPTILRKSEYSDPMAYKAITPSPVQYNDIFRKKPTPDERLYILKQIQQGLDKVQKGILGKIPGAPTVTVPSATAPSATQPSDEIGQTIGAPPGGPPPSGGEGIPIDDVPAAMNASPVSSNGAQFPEGEGAQVSVENDPRQTDGVDEVQQALTRDEEEAVETLENQVTIDVVDDNRRMIAEDSFIDSSSESSGGQTENDKKIDITHPPKKPSSWEGSYNDFKKWWNRRSADEKREVVSKEMAMQGPQPEIVLPKTTDIRPKTNAKRSSKLKI